MKPQELRIGNYVWHTLEKDHEHKNYTHRIQTISVHQEKPECVLVLFGYFPPCTIDFIEPIPLTEEWLVKFGFNDLGYGIVKVFNTLEFSWLKDSCLDITQINTYEYETIYTTGLIKYVHQLQNLYFALTGEELEIKNP